MKARYNKGFVFLLIQCISISACFGQQSQIRTRLDWRTFAQDPSRLNAFKRAINELKHRSSVDRQDPTGWIYQANIHDTTDTMPNNAPPPEDWQGCEHHTSHFLTWHRGYLYYFEQILRQASGDDSLNLPYWAWDSPTERTLPAEFRDQAHHPDLWVDGRNLNDPKKVLPKEVGPGAAFREDTFLPKSFVHAGFSSALENPPHDTVHVITGGLMRSTTTAARDPVFWLHHCNIDRLWEKWKAGTNHSDPPSSQWGNPTFSYRDRDGHLIHKTASEVEDAHALGYQYADQSPVLSGAPIVLAQGPNAVPLNLAPTVQAKTLGSGPGQVVVADAPKTIGLDAPSLKVNDAVNAAAPQSSSLIALALRKLQQGVDSSVIYRVYVHAKSKPFDATTAVHVGTVVLFDSGHSKHGNSDFTFNVTDAVRKIVSEAGKDNSGIAVTLVPTSGDVDAKPAPPSANSKLTIEKIELETVKPGGQ